jgi:hypothetical protein
MVAEIVAVAVLIAGDDSIGKAWGFKCDGVRSRGKPVEGIGAGSVCLCCLGLICLFVEDRH